MKRNIPKTKRYLHLFTTIILSVLIYSCTKLEEAADSLTLKDDSMTDEVYIKIDVRWAYEVRLKSKEMLKPGTTNPEVYKNVLDMQLSVQKELCKKYGFTVDAKIKKHDEIHASKRVTCIIYNIDIMRKMVLGQIYGLPEVDSGHREPIEDTEEGWNKFFIDNEKYLSCND